MTPLTKLSQIKVGTKLKIIASTCEKDNYESVTVKRIIECDNRKEPVWTEILICRKNNYYFHFQNYLLGKSRWVEKVWVLK